MQIRTREFPCRLQRTLSLFAMAGAMLILISIAPAMAQNILKASGNNHYGQLGDGTNTNSNVPIDVSDIRDIMQATAGSLHSIVLKNDGSVWTWGRNIAGQLGDGTNTNSTIPALVQGLKNVMAISAGDSHSLALKSGGTVWAWGNNGHGQLGNGTDISSSNIPVQVSELKGMAAIAAGEFHSLALKNNGSVWAWGNNFYGQLGGGTGIDTSNVPIQVQGLANVTAIAAGSHHSLALKTDGTVWAWGYGPYGELGNGRKGFSSAPVRVQGLTGVTAIATGYSHSLALKTDGTVWAWGNSIWGQLGNSLSVDTSVPVQVQSLLDIKAIAAGFYYSLALKTDGTVRAWGDNRGGQLGVGTDIYMSSVPVLVQGLTNVTAIAGGTYHSLFLSNTVLGNVFGTIGLQGIVDSAMAQTVTFTFTPKNGNTIIKTANIGASGIYILTALPAGSYSVRIKGAKYLAKRLNITVQSGGTAILSDMLTAGDATDDNVIDVADLLLILYHFNQTLANNPSSYLETADFNGDGANDAADLLTVIGNYNQIGD